MRPFLVFLIVDRAVTGLADTLYKKDGGIGTGTDLGGTARQVRMDLGDRVDSYDVSDVIKIEFQPAVSSAPPPPPRDVRRTEVEPQDRGRLIRPDPPSRPAPPPAASGIIPAGTALPRAVIDWLQSANSPLR